MSRRKFRYIGTPEKLGHFQPGDFVVLMKSDFTTDWSEIFQVGVMPSAFFGNDMSTKHWGGRVLVSAQGNIQHEHNSRKARKVNDVGTSTGKFKSPTADKERELELAKAKAKIEAETKAKAAKADLLKVRQFGYVVFKDDAEAQRELDRIVQLYRSTHVKLFEMHFEPPAVNNTGVFAKYHGKFGYSISPGYPVQAGDAIYNIRVEDKDGNVIPEAYRVRVTLRGIP